MVKNDSGLDKKETGRRIKELRMAHNLSISELAKAANVSKSLISQVERSEVYPSLKTLEKIADVLGVHLSKFFQIENPVNDFSNCIVKNGKQRVVFMPETNNRYHILTPNLRNSAMEFLLIEYPPNSQSDTGDRFRHAGQEYFYVLEGALTIGIDGKTYLLEQGDSGCFDSSATHYFLNKTDKTAKLIIAATDPAI